MAAFIEDDSNSMDNEGDSSEKDLPWLVSGSISGTTLPVIPQTDYGSNPFS